VHVVNVRSNEIIGCFRGHTAAVTSVALTPDGRSALSGDEDGNLLYWNRESRRVIECRHVHFGAVTALAIAASGAHAASGGTDGVTRLWRLDGDSCRESPLERMCWREEVTALAFGDDDSRLIAGGRAGRVDLWECVEGACLRSLRGSDVPIACVHSGNVVTALPVPPDGAAPTHLAVLRWHADTGVAMPPVKRLSRPRCIPSCAALDRAGMRLLIAGRYPIPKLCGCMPTEKARAWLADWLRDVGDGVREFLGLRGDPARLINRLRSRPLYALEVWSLTSGVRLHAYAGVAGEIAQLAVSPDNTRILAAFATGGLQTFAMPLA
jgi:hypothetical protein